MEIDRYKVGAGVFAIIAIVLAAGLANQDNVYVCEDSQMALICDKLSATNVNNIQTRCYFYSEELERDTYKVCKSGWEKFEKQEVILNKTTDEFVCESKSSLIQECVSEDGTLLLKVTFFNDEK